MKENLILIKQIHTICKQLGELEKKFEKIESVSENDFSSKKLFLKEYENGIFKKIDELIICYKLYQK